MKSHPQTDRFLRLRNQIINELNKVGIPTSHMSKNEEPDGIGLRLHVYDVNASEEYSADDVIIGISLSKKDRSFNVAVWPFVRVDPEEHHGIFCSQRPLSDSLCDEVEDFLNSTKYIRRTMSGDAWTPFGEILDRKTEYEDAIPKFIEEVKRLFDFEKEHSQKVIRKQNLLNFRNATKDI